MYYYNICDEVIIISTPRLPICLSGTNLHEKLPYKENFHGLLKLFGLQLLILKVFGFFFCWKFLVLNATTMPSCNKALLGFNSKIRHPILGFSNPQPAGGNQCVVHQTLYQT